MDFNLVLILILSVITINMLVVGFYIVVTLKDLRETLKKMNSVLDDAGSIVNAVANPLNMVGGIVSAVVDAFKKTRSITSLRE